MMKFFVLASCLAAVALAGISTMDVDYFAGEAGVLPPTPQDFIAGVQFGPNLEDCGGLAGRYSVQLLGRNDDSFGMEDLGFGRKPRGPSKSKAPPSQPGCPSFHGQMEIAPRFDGTHAIRECGIDLGNSCCVRMVGITCETNARPGCHFATTNDNIQLGLGTFEGWGIPFLSTIFSIDQNLGSTYAEDDFESMLSVTPSGEGQGLYFLGGQRVFREMFVADSRGRFPGNEGCVFNGEARFVAALTHADPFDEFDDAGYDNYYYYGGKGSKATKATKPTTRNVTPKFKSLFDIDLKEWREKKTLQQAEQKEARQQARQLRNLQRSQQ